MEINEEYGKPPTIAIVGEFGQRGPYERDKKNIDQEDRKDGDLFRIAHSHLAVGNS